jgi:uncharacterized membrane protein
MSRHAHRVIFIDFARALAVVFMLYGHTIDALLAPVYRTGVWYDVWLFQRGLTSSLFLVLSGFAFSVATSKRWSSHTVLSPALLKRVRRFAMFALLGYSLHFPTAHLVDLPSATEAQWRTFLAVDVLQLIGVTFIGVQILVLITRSRRVFMTVALLLTALIVSTTGVVWSIDWTGRLPQWIAAYLTPAAGSQFPVFPWAGFILLGVGLGQVYARWGDARLTLYANALLLAAGGTMLATVFVLRLLSVPIFGTGPTSFVPSEFLMRAGVCLLVLGGIAHASTRMTRLPHVFSAVAQETLLIYFVHLCIVYGSVWNRGLSHVYGQTLGPVGTSFCVLVLLVSMGALAYYWNWCKHARPRLARGISAVWAVLLISLLI